jgi:hypothetical protein
MTPPLFSSTSDGWPYIAGTQNASLIDDYAVELANKLDATVPFAFASGTVTVSLTAASSGTATVTFPTSRFSVAPIITATKVSGSGSATPLVPMVTTVSSTGATIGLYHPAGTAVTVSVTVHWIAIQANTGSASG